MPGHGGDAESEGHDEGTGELSGMSPSEIEEIQRKNCVFCHIASGKVPARKVYEDSECIAVLDINPANQGHMLLMPKEHYTIMLQVPEHLIGHLLVIAKGLSQAGLKAFQSKGTTIFAANGTSAGQRAPHFMLHVIPRLDGDSIGLYIPSRALPEKEAEKIAAALSAALGGRKPGRSETAEKQEKDEAKKAEKPTATETKAEAPKSMGGSVPSMPKGKRGNTPSMPKGKEDTNLDSITDFLTKGEGGAK